MICCWSSAPICCTPISPSPRVVRFPPPCIELCGLRCREVRLPELTPNPIKSPRHNARHKDQTMSHGALVDEIRRRRTFAIISHPDAGKTTITEKLLLFGRLIQKAGMVKGKKTDRHATSDWMTMEQERGISVTSSVMQFPYHERMVNLLDTPGHEDFSEDTYRVLTAVDSALMVVDCAKGVEERTIKLMDVCRLRDTPILTFVNKMDRDIRDPIDLLDEIERILNIKCAPITWPIGMGKLFKGIYHLTRDEIIVYDATKKKDIHDVTVIQGLGNLAFNALVGEQ